MNTVERSSHPTRAQVETLLAFLEANPSLAKGFAKVASARDVARRHWERLAVQLNSMGGSTKSWKQWNKYWADKKSAAKKKTAARAAARRKTGGGVEDEVELTEVEERIVALMGGVNFAVGDIHLAINPFNEPASQPPAPQPPAPEPLAQQQLANIPPLNTSADPCIPATSYPSARQSHVPNVLNMPGSTTSPRTPPIEAPLSAQSTPSRQGASHPFVASSSPMRPHHIGRHSQLPIRNTTPRHRRRLIPSRSPPSQRRSPPSQRRSQFASLTDHFLRLEEQNIQQSNRNTDLLSAMTAIAARQTDALTEVAERQTDALAVMAQGLNSIGEGIKMLAEYLNK